MDQKIVEQIFLHHGLGEIKSFQKIEIGWTNKVFSVNDNFILKFCEDETNEEKFEREVFFYEFFENKVPVPKIRIYDNSKKIYGKFFMIYPKIQGDNLYSKWHLLSNEERNNITAQLCEILKVISKSPYDEFVKRLNLNSSMNWRDKVVSQIEKSLGEIAKRQLLQPEFIKAIRNFVEQNSHVLAEQKIALVYWDAHFDNILVQNTKIVGILDFERTELSSIDFNLDIVKRMVEYPKKYMSEEFEKFARKEDYAQLLDWFREFYPELFDFKDLDKRLDLYAVEHDLDTLLGWPNSDEVKQMIAKSVGYKKEFAAPCQRQISLWLKRKT